MKGYDLYVNHVEVGDSMEWTWPGPPEETLGGIGRVQIILQDRTLVYEPVSHWDVEVKIHSSGKTLFRGEIISVPLELPVGLYYRRWVLDCADYNWEMDWRLVGAPDGTQWMDPEGFGNWVTFDPYAQSNATDGDTFKLLLDHYLRVDGQAIDTTEHVGTYLPAGSFTQIFFTYQTLRGSLDSLASFPTQNIQYWIDPYLKGWYQAIPSWQELTQEAVSNDAPGARGLPELVSGLGSAPAQINNDVTPNGTTIIGCRDLQFTFDGGTMPEQVYVKGATGYTYDVGKPPIRIPAVAAHPKAASSHVKITVNRPQFLYSREAGTGYLVDAGITLPPGTILDGVHLSVAENPAHPLQNNNDYYRIQSGPYKGLLLDEHTNRLAPGNITVERASGATTPAPPGPPGPPPAPVIGTGGSGWVGGVQDPNKRQAYIDDQNSSTQADRDSIGGQAIYRGKFPTLRGSCTVTGGFDEEANQVGPDDWHVGQLLRIVDLRLPDTLNGRYFIIQRVVPKTIPDTDQREYRLEWGDGPTQRQSSRRVAEPKVPKNMAPGSTQMYLLEADTQPKPGSRQVISAQLVSPAGIAWPIQGRVVNWQLQVVDEGFNEVVGQGFLDPFTSVTDREGIARTVLECGPASGLTYFIYTDSPAY